MLAFAALFVPAFVPLMLFRIFVLCNIFLFVFFSSSGVVSIDIELSSIDINQCDAQASNPTDDGRRDGSIDRTASTDSVKLLDFLGTHKCKRKSTKVSKTT